jgi:hypothetical protein
MNAELDRFLKLFDALAVATNAWLDTTPPEKLDWTPFDNPNMKFGDRISTITVRSLYIHTIVGEVGWAKILPAANEGDSFKPAGDGGLTQRLMESKDLVGDVMKLHGENMEAYGSLGDDQLAKRIRWMDREWSIMGFLWGIYSHRSYHLGNIDLYLREADLPAPDFFSNFRQVMA